MKYYSYRVDIDGLYNPLSRPYKCDTLHEVKEYLHRMIPKGYVLSKDGWRKERSYANVLHYINGDFTNGEDYRYVLIKRVYIGGKNLPYED